MGHSPFFKRFFLPDFERTINSMTYHPSTWGQQIDGDPIPERPSNLDTPHAPGNRKHHVFDVYLVGHPLHRDAPLLQGYIAANTWLFGSVIWIRRIFFLWILRVFAARKTFELKKNLRSEAPLWTISPNVTPFEGFDKNLLPPNHSLTPHAADNSLDLSVANLHNDASWWWHHSW